MRDDLKAMITHHYGSAAKFEQRAGIYRSTLSRVLAGKYAGNAGALEERIRKQLALDGITVERGEFPALADRSLGIITDRLECVSGSLRLAQRASNQPEIAAMLEIASAEIECIRGHINGRKAD